MRTTSTGGRRTLVLALALACMSTGTTRAVADSKAKPDEPFSKLKYRSIGPAAGGRVCRVTGVPGNPLIYFAATASSGVWKSIDGGISFKPIFDDQPTASAGSIAVAQSDPNVVYVGSGEANIRGNVQGGLGIFKSNDGGKTWKHVWKQAGQIGTIIVHPNNSQIAFAAVLGKAFAPNSERGVYRTTDGGKNWHKVLFKDNDTGASDVCFDPSNPSVMFAGFWQTRRRPWELTSGGPGSGLYTSRDGGDTWKQIKGNGLPEGIWGKVGVAVAPSDGRRVYVLIEAEKGGLFRSDDGGEKWSLASGHKVVRQRAWYYSTITVDPKNPNVLWMPNVPMVRSIDRGKTLETVRGIHHGDNHDIWIDPVDPKRMISCNDGGVDISVNGGESWYNPKLPISQFYHINVDNRVPYWISGTMQDIGAAMGPSNSLSYGGISLNDWHSMGGGETGYTAHDAEDPNIVYAGEYGAAITRYDHRIRQARNVTIYPDNPSGHGAEAMKYRFRWPAPILMSPHNSKVIYHAGNVLFKTTDGGQHWNAISGDLTRNDKRRQQWSGGPITGDNTTAEFYCTISSVAESPKQKDVLWVGSDDGLVHVSKDGGKNWANVTAKMEGFPEWGTVKTIEASPFDAASCYVVVDAHMMDDTHPYLYQTKDFGATWKLISAHLAQDVHLHVVREDPRKKGLLYVGTERGVMLTNDEGKTWRPLRLNMPTVAIHDIIIKNDDLVLATNGRSIWILDNLTPIREWTEATASKELELFPTTPAIRWGLYGPIGAFATAENPPNGVLIHYWLKSKPKGELVIEILDAQNKVIRKLTSKPEKEPVENDADGESEDSKKEGLPTEPGLHRILWDMRYEGGKKIPKAKIDAGKPDAGPMALAGNYTARLTVDGKTLTQKVEIKVDPRSIVPPTDLAAQLAVTLRIRDDFTKMSATVVRLRQIVRQISHRNELLAGDKKYEQLVKQSKEFVGKLDALENKLHNPKAQVTYDILAMKGGAKLYSKFGALYDVAMDGEGPPTQGLLEVLGEREKEFAGYLAEFDKLLTADLVNLNKLARTLDAPHIMVPPEKKDK